MKIPVLFTSLELLCIIDSVRGGLRSLPVGTLEVDDPLEVVYDKEISYRHKLERNDYDHEEERVDGLSPSHASAHSRQLGGDPLSPGISSAALRMSCNSQQRAVMISKSLVTIVMSTFRLCLLNLCRLCKIYAAIKTDREGHETSWSLTKNGESAPRYYGPEGGENYLSSTSYSGTVCVAIGMYEFTIKGMSLRT